MASSPHAAAPVRGRLAPTPSGRMHLGNVFSALMSWAAVRHTGGELVLRIEDLDPRAADPTYAQLLMDDLHWLGIEWDGEVAWQSKRGAVYEHAIEQLEAQGLIYPCFCTRAELHAARAPHASDGTYIYPGTCRNLTSDEVDRRLHERPAALRLRVPDAADPAAEVTFDDLVYGVYHENLAHDCGDFLVRRSDGVVAYQLAVVVDDAAAGVNLVVRGRDLLPSSARQIYLQGLLGYEQPRYLHIPLLVAPDGRRLAKRDADLDLGTLRQHYASPELLVGRLAAAVGMAEAGEALSAQELAERFSLSELKVHRADIVVDDGFLP